MTAGRMLRQGQRGRDVSQLQSALDALGYDVGEIDGIFGRTTHNAVMAFQSDQGLSPDGIVGPNTFDALHANLEALDDDMMGSGDEDEEGWRVGERMLSRGSQGDDVAQLQEALDELGFDPGAIDGIFGPQTRRAVVAFQRDAGLGADGVVGPNTAEALFEQLEGGGSDDSSAWDDDSASEDDDDDDDWDEDDEDDDEDDEDDIDPESWTLGERDLELGDKGSDVTELQELLEELDYEPGDLDGYFGPKTEASVLSFQEDQDLEATGVVDAETLELLLEEAEREEGADDDDDWDDDDDADWDDDDSDEDDDDEDDDDDSSGWDDEDWDEE